MKKQEKAGAGECPLKLFSLWLKWEISMQWKSTPQIPVRAPWTMGLHRHSACPGAGSPRGTVCTHLGFCRMHKGFECVHMVKQNGQGCHDSMREHQVNDFVSALVSFFQTLPGSSLLWWKLGDLLPPPSSHRASSCEKLWDLSLPFPPCCIHSLFLLIKGVAALSSQASHEEQRKGNGL